MGSESLHWQVWHVAWHTSTSKVDNFLSKADSVPWISTHVIITELGNPLKGYVGVVKDVLRDNSC
jgi:hypothetical protein